MYNNSPTLGELGILGTAVRFNNSVTNQDATVASNANLSIQNGGSDALFSIGFWIYPSSTAGYLVGKSSNTSGNYEWEVGLSSGKITFTIYDGGTNTSRIVRNTNTVISLNTWYYVVCTYDGSGTITGTNVYLNSVIDNSVSSGVVGTFTGVSLTSSPLRIANAENTGNTYNGIIDELCIWKGEELTLSKISEIYNNGNGLNLT